MVKKKVAMLLISFRSRNGLQILGDLFGVTKIVVSLIIRKFCTMVRLDLVMFLSEYKFRELEKDFEALHSISYVVRVVDGSCIPILLPINGMKIFVLRNPSTCNGLKNMRDCMKIISNKLLKHVV